MSVVSIVLILHDRQEETGWSGQGPAKSLNFGLPLAILDTLEGLPTEPRLVHGGERSRSFRVWFFRAWRVKADGGLERCARRRTVPGVSRDLVIVIKPSQRKMLVVLDAIFEGDSGRLRHLQNLETGDRACPNNTAQAFVV
jgi:hypothetical protein